ncbi:2,3-bisphosphoglycerate-independent phosphoglycerate mutase [bacterium]|nr:2,3-bisphosphoglycerate-independent phosphoglycerate mutase [bacterium]
MRIKQPVILIIRDGWGYSPKKKNNYINLAKTPNEDYYLKNYPHGLLDASGQAVGLEKGYQGNSEVGHLTLGSGRIILQSMVKINKAIRTGEFFKNKALLKTIKDCKKNKSKLHLIGLLQDQGVHAHIDHLFALLDLCQKEDFKDVLIHVITDGRDAPTTESLKHLKRLERKLKDLGFGQIVTISGRYYAMDRDLRWSRTKKAYDCIVSGKGKEFVKVKEQIKACHKSSEFDEFIKPRRLKGYQGFSKDDGAIFFNFRTDRPRQLTKAIVEKNFKEFKRTLIPKNFTTMTQYYHPINAKVAFENINIDNILGQVVSKAGFKQLRISETEKYAHVTFFFNGQKEKPFKGESRALIPSPKVATYDLKPEMSAFKIAKRLVREINKEDYELVVVNLVNCDMVGHTGKARAITKAVEAVDCAQGKIVKSALEKGYTCLLLGDHGNAEDKNSNTATSHTTNPVPVILISKNEKLQKVKILKGFGLRDVAPTILKLMGIKIPKEMTGKSFIK